MPERYELWLDAQIYSKKASESYEKFQDIINPLESTRSQAVLDRMWKAIDMVQFNVSQPSSSLLIIDAQNYFGVSSVFIDNLWQLEDAHRRTPQWSVVYMPDFPMSDYDSGSEDATTGLVKRDPRRNELKKQQRKLLAITDGRADDSYDDMPGLRSVSDTSDESDADYDSDDDDEGGDDDDDETAYDEEEDVVYRNFHREAMDAARTIPEFLDRNAHVPEFDAMAEECKENPFFKILSSLQGSNMQKLYHG